MPQELVHRGQMLRLSFREPVPTEASMLRGRTGGGDIGVDQGSLRAWHQSVILSSIFACVCAAEVLSDGMVEVKIELELSSASESVLMNSYIMQRLGI